MAVWKRWVVIGAVVVVAVSVAYVLVTRTKKPDTGEQEAYIAEVQKARDEVPEALTLEEAQKEYEEFVAKHADWQEKVTDHGKELRKAYEADPSNGELARDLVWHLWNAGDVKAAKEVCERWAAAAPESARAWHELASCCRELDLDDEADAAMGKIEGILGHESAFVHAIRSSKAHGQFDAFTAMSEAEKAVEVATTDAEKAVALRTVAEAHLTLNSEMLLDDEERWEHYRAGYEAAKESLDYEDSLAAHAQLFFAANRYLDAVRGKPAWKEQDKDRLPRPGEAREHLQKALDDWPHSARPWAVLSRDRQARDDDYGAWSAAKIARFLAPKDTGRLGWFAVCAEYIDMEPDATEARELLAKALAGGAGDQWDEVTAAMLRSFAGEVAHAKAHGRVAAPKLACLIYPHVRDRIAGYSRAMFEMGWALRHAGKYDEALEAAQISLQHPGMMAEMGTDMLANAAICAAAAGQPDLADKYVARLSADAPASACTYNDIAWQTALFGGNYDWALTVIDRAIEADLSHLGYQDTKAYLLVKKGDFEEARTICDKLIEAGVGGFAVGYLGLMCETEGDHAKALEYLRQVELPSGATDADLPGEFEEVRERLEAQAQKAQR